MTAIEQFSKLESFTNGKITTFFKNKSVLEFTYDLIEVLNKKQSKLK
jgi:hypothetical protein